MSITWELCHYISFCATIVGSIFVFAGIVGTHVSSNRIKIKEKTVQAQKDVTHTAELSRIEEENEQKRKELESKLAQKDTEYQVDSAKKDERIAVLNKQIEDAKTTLSHRPPDIIKTDSGYTVKLTFQPSNINPIGMVGFGAKIISSSDTKILKFWPLPPSSTGKDSMKISDDGKTVKLGYSLLGGGWPQVELQLSGSAQVVISGSHELQPAIINVE